MQTLRPSFAMREVVRLLMLAWCFLGLSFLARSSIVKDTSRASRGLSFIPKRKSLAATVLKFAQIFKKILIASATSQLLVVASSPVEAATAAAQQHFHFN
jgi:hypothetical protein